METDTLPANWREMDEVPYPFQVKMWRNSETMHVLAIEGKEEPWHDEEEGRDYQVVLLSDEFATEPEPIRTVLRQTKDPDEAESEATRFMHENPDG